MTIFIPEAVADTPSWMLAHHPLSVPDVLPSAKDPTTRQQWVEQAARERDPAVRLYTLEDRPLIPGPVLFRAHRQTTPAAAVAWFLSMATAPGHRLVLVDPAAPNRLDSLLEDDGGCDVCSETRPALWYDAHRKHQESAS